MWEPVTDCGSLCKPMSRGKSLTIRTISDSSCVGCETNPKSPAEQLRSFVGSSLEIAASSFDLSSLVNTDPQKIHLDQFERQLRDRLDEQALNVYGITIRQVGIERLTLPAETLKATVERMKAERATVAAERSAEGQRAANEITSNAYRDARVLVAKAKADAAGIEAKARVEAADIYGKAYSSDPELYTLLRSLDTLGSGDRRKYQADPENRCRAVQCAG